MVASRRSSVRMRSASARSPSVSGSKRVASTARAAAARPRAGAEARPRDGAAARPRDGAAARPRDGAAARPRDGAAARPRAGGDPPFPAGLRPAARPAVVARFFFEVADLTARLAAFAGGLVAFFARAMARTIHAAGDGDAGG